MVNRNVEIADIGSSAPSVDMSIMGLFAQSDLVVKTVMLMLLFSSFWCWAIIFSKWRRFKKIKKNHLKFEKAYRSASSIDDLYKNMSKENLSSPSAAMFVEGYKNANLSPDKLQSRIDSDLLGQYKEKILNAVDRVKNDYLSAMEDKLIILATVGSAAPFIGLFGTVWGIVNSFQAIAASKNTSLAVVAPGIAEALLATAIGLFAAIPAVVFYNLFSNDIRRVAGKLDDYANELSTTLAYREA